MMDQRNDPERRLQHNQQERVLIQGQRHDQERRLGYNNQQRIRMQELRNDEERRLEYNEQERNAARIRNLRMVNRAACHTQRTLQSEQLVQYISIGNRTELCGRCNALKWPAELFSSCCNNGKIILDLIPEPPPTLKQLWENDTRKAKIFRQHSRILNNCLALASQKVQEVLPVNGGGWNPSVVIQGKMYHRIGPLRAQDDQVPTFAQIYIHDPVLDDTKEALRLGKIKLLLFLNNKF